jgi:tRNA modification GTPase
VDVKLASLLADSTRFERLSHEPRIVLAGRPNAGKSTLLNALAGRQRAVTSPVAGTTRDVISAEVALRRGIVQLIDAAGIDAGPGANQPDIERQMTQNALRALEAADVLVLVRDSTDQGPPLTLSRPPDFVVRTKSDLSDASRVSDDFRVSAKTGENVDLLRERLDALAFGDASAAAGASLSLNARHVRAVSEARDALHRARASDAPAEIVALELRESLDALGRVVGMVSPDDVLGRIFSTFCIGK